MTIHFLLLDNEQRILQIVSSLICETNALCEFITAFYSVKRRLLRPCSFRRAALKHSHILGISLSSTLAFSPRATFVYCFQQHVVNRLVIVLLKPPPLHQHATLCLPNMTSTQECLHQSSVQIPTYLNNAIQFHSADAIAQHLRT